MIFKTPIFRAARYLARRILSVSLTIVIGVFLTIVIANRGGMVDQIARERVESKMMLFVLDPNFHGDLAVERARLEVQEGLNVSFLPKHLIYTFKALTLDWGSVWDVGGFRVYIKTDKGVVGTTETRRIILSQMPNTLLLAGIAYLIVALLGISLALFLSQREGHWLDRLVGLLTPISSMPSWVLGVLLVVLFAVDLKIFPVGKMMGTIPPQTTWETIKVVAYHLVLPVTAIVLSLLFQMAYTWRTYLMIYSDEDYVTLARAKGLQPAKINRQYLLRPALPYMLTSFSLTLVGFWQTITALEFFFQWPGIGKMFVDALPNFRGEAMYRGEMSIVTGIVVVFAYLLGITILCLDLAYVLVDPRLRIESSELDLGKLAIHTIRKPADLLRDLFRKQQPAPVSQNTTRKIREASRIKCQPGQRITGLRANFHSLRGAWHDSWAVMRKTPFGTVSLVLVGLLFICSAAVMIWIPYNPVGKNWTEGDLTGRPTSARLALPVWVNWFRKEKLPSTIVLNSADGTARKVVEKGTGGIDTTTIEFSFEYPYPTFPSEVSVYFSAHYSQKSPFASLTWITPQGDEIHLKNTSVTDKLNYSVGDNTPFRQLLAGNDHFQKWFVSSGNYITPGYQLLFADPQVDTPRVEPGKYILRIDGMLFEPGSDLDAQLVIFGLVQGWAGTDFYRRDLLVPLLWGLPFALLVGILGALATGLGSITMAGIGVWFGGWVDGLIQKLVEANLVLPVMAIGVLLCAYYQLNLWLVLGIIILLNVLGSPTKAFRAAFLQVKESGFIEAARAYGASDWRIIFRYLIPRTLPAMIPQIINLIPTFFFLEATLAIFNVSDPRFPTWGRILYSALRYGSAYGSRYWVLEPIMMMLLTSFIFALLSFSLNRILNPHLRSA